MAMRYCKDCQLYECCMRTPLGGCQELDNVAPELKPPVAPEDAWKHLYEQADWTWEKFRREAAKDILANIMSCPATMNLGDKTIKTVGDYVSFAVGLADELIKRLKEDKK